MYTYISTLSLREEECWPFIVSSFVQMDPTPTSRPSELIQNSEPSIRNYIFEIESKLEKLLVLEKYYSELDTKYLDIQEDLFSMQIRNHECKSTEEELKKENDILRLKNDELTKENEHLKQQLETQQSGKELFDLLSSPLSDNGDSRGETTITTDNSKNAETNNANSILIKNMPKGLMDFDGCSKKAIILLGKLINLKLTPLDIKRVDIKERKFYERQNMQPDKIILIVEFSNQDLKVDFLKHKEKLKKVHRTQEIDVTDFVSEDVYNLYQYAKILKSHGYNSVYWRNNCVYAKKTRSTASQPILIKSQSQVDLLKLIK